MKILLGILSILIVSACGTEANIDHKRTSESSEKTSQDSFELEMDDYGYAHEDFMDPMRGPDHLYAIGLEAVGIDFPAGMPATALVRIECNTETGFGQMPGTYEGTVHNKKLRDYAFISHKSGFEAVAAVSTCEASIYDENGTLKFFKVSDPITRHGNFEVHGWTSM